MLLPGNAARQSGLPYIHSPGSRSYACRPEQE